MGKGPVGLHLFKVCVGVGVLFFLGMLYWSSLLVERDARELRQELAEVRATLASLQARPLAPAPVRHEVVVEEEEVFSLYPNLLGEDPFYASTLPTLLGASFFPEGMMHEASVGKPHNLHPFSGWAPVASAHRMCVATVGRPQFGQYERFAPSLAKRVELREREDGGSEFWVFLREDAFWHPLEKSHFPTGFELAPHFLERHRVTAHDFKFWFDVLMNPYVEGASSIRNYFRDIEEFRVEDDDTFVVRWREDGGRMKYSARSLTMGLQPLASWVYEYFSDGSKIVEEGDYRTNSVWAQNFAHHWAQNVIPSCGAWVFDGWSGSTLQFRRNPDYFEPYAALTESRQVTFKESPDGIWQDFKAGVTDVFESRYAPEKMGELVEFEASSTYLRQVENGAAIKQVDFLDPSYRYVGWNQANPLFVNKRVRQALTMAIDRRRIISQNLNGLGVATTGPFSPNDPAYDPTIMAWPFDPLEAQRLLEQEGWYDSDGDGIRDKIIDGKKVKFSFSLCFYVKSTLNRTIADYISTALKDVGIECKPVGMDTADVSAAFEGKNFDAILLSWMMSAPPHNPRQIWHSSGANERGSSNAIGFAHPEADEIIDALQYEADEEERIALYHRFHQILHEEQPYTFLYTPIQSFLYREYVKNVFIPAERPDLVPDATVTEPVTGVFFLANREIDV